MNYLENLNWRYATKKMTGAKIEKSKIENILEAIRLAPTAYGLQPFHVFVISNIETKEKISGAAFNQPQVKDCSDLLVFVANLEVSPEYVSAFIENVSKTRDMDISENEGYKNMILGFLENIKGNVLTWSSKQAYIALGFGLFAASLEKVDATPMEGFLPDQVDAILGLSEKGLHSVCLLALGERDSESDYLSKMKKVRQSKESMFTFL